MAPKRSLSDAGIGAAKRQAHVTDFQHKPLDDARAQVRLLKMLPQDDEDHRRCPTYEMVHQSLAQSVPFYAISYTWGSDTDQTSITIDGKPFKVFRNCFDVLRLVSAHWRRKALEGEYIWIDSVCINQTDDAEKSLQVSIMAEIYANATDVLAYLGPHSEDSQFLFRNIQDIADIPYDCGHEEFLCLECQKPWVSWVLSLGPKRLNRLCVTCGEFGERNYWKRVWIIQETAKATSLSILCGDDILCWKLLRNLEEFLSLEMDEIPDILSAYPRITECPENSMHHVFAARRESLSIGSILTRYSGSQCTNPRDRVYGLLSLIQWPEGRAPIIPAYRISMFELAKQVEAYVTSLDELQEILRLFKVTALDSAVLQAAGRRRQSREADGRQTSGEPDAEFKALVGEGRSPTICALIVSDQQGNLTTALDRYDDEDGLSSSEPLYSPQSGEATSHWTEAVEVTPEFVASMAEGFQARQPQKLMLDSDVAGYVCSGALKGDSLVPLTTASGKVFLVVRENKGEIFDIIGQAFLLPGFELGVQPALCGEETDKSGFFEGRVELRLSSEDAALLFAQDMSEDADYYEPQGRCERVFTSVSLDPSSVGAARIASQSWLSVSEAIARFKSASFQPIDHFEPPAAFSRLEPGRWYIGPEGAFEYSSGTS